MRNVFGLKIRWVLASSVDMLGTMNVVTGPGDPSIAQDLYRTAILREIALMRGEGVYVCMANVMARMPSYNQGILGGTLWVLALEGQLS